MMTHHRPKTYTYCYAASTHHSSLITAPYELAANKADFDLRHVRAADASHLRTFFVTSDL